MTLFPMGLTSGGHSTLEIRGPSLGNTGGGYDFKQYMMTPNKDSIKLYNASINLMTSKTNFEAKLKNSPNQN